MLEDDVLQWRAVQRALKGLGDVTAVGSCAAANDAIGQGRWSGLLVDVTLPDGSGLKWLAGARSGGCNAPALVLTNLVDRDLINTAFDLQALYVCKPLPAQGFRDFVGSLSSRRHRREPRDAGRKQFGLLARSALRVLASSGLTGAELEIISAALAGTSPQDFRADQGITMNTYKTQVRSILRKTGADSVGDLRDRVLREAGLKGWRS